MTDASEVLKTDCRVVATSNGKQSVWPLVPLWLCGVLMVIACAWLAIVTSSNTRKLDDVVPLVEQNTAAVQGVSHALTTLAEHEAEKMELVGELRRERAAKKAAAEAARASDK